MIYNPFALVAERLALIGKYSVDLEAHVTIEVEPMIQYRLEHFQVRCRNGCLCRLWSHRFTAHNRCSVLIILKT